MSISEYILKYMAPSTPKLQSSEMSGHLADYGRLKNRSEHSEWEEIKKFGHQLRFVEAAAIHCHRSGLFERLEILVSPILSW